MVQSIIPALLRKRILTGIRVCKSRRRVLEPGFQEGVGQGTGAGKGAGAQHEIGGTTITLKVAKESPAVK